VLNLPASTTIFLCREPVDFRKAHDGLTAIIRDELVEDLFAGGIFVFLNKRRDRIKLLEWDRNGLWLHYKRLEKGTFKWVAPGTSSKVSMTRAELSMLLEGIDLKAGKMRPHFADGIRIKRRDEERGEARSAARRRRSAGVDCAAR
jgi:transposase